MKTLLSLCITLLFLSVAMISGASESESLIVFVQTGISEVDASFQAKTLPEIRKIAEEMNVPLHVRNVADGVPSEVTITPLIVFQNHRGRSIYQGRTTTLDRVRSFVRTSRFVPQGSEPFVRKDTPVFHHGKAKVVAPIKITSLEGHKPAGFNDGMFLKKMRNAIDRSFTEFKTENEVKVRRADRGFYMDFYPWRSDKGELFLSVAVFSQFHCKTPVYQPADPFKGPWPERDRVFAEAAAAMESAVFRQMKDSKSGDGFDPVEPKVQETTWSAIGFQLPDAPQSDQAAIDPNAPLPLNWIVDVPDKSEPPLISFRFPAPLDAYFGQVGAVRAELHMKAERELAGATGYIEADPLSVTMGVPDLDSSIQGKGYLDSSAHPVSRFELTSIETEEKLAYGKLTPAQVNGRFKLKGVEVPLSIRAEVEPVIGPDGKPRLLGRGSFSIDLKSFKISGADGPEPQRNTILFDINLKLKPN
jgi:polyisoprenoid-binding protein YceI